MKTNWKKIRAEIQRKNQKFILAVSGGVDSMHGLNFFIKTENIEFIVAHFNHHIRNESGDDEELIRKQCQDLGIPFIVGHGVNIKNEEQARSQRYKFLFDALTEHKYDKVVVFHHQDDQLETIMLNLMRGKPFTHLHMNKDEDKVYRPFLNTPKEDILKSAVRYKIKWNEDSTNKENNYDRNWLRNEVIPLLSQRRNIKKSILNGLSKTLA